MKILSVQQIYNSFLKKWNLTKPKGAKWRLLYKTIKHFSHTKRRPCDENLNTRNYSQLSREKDIKY